MLRAYLSLCKSSSCPNQNYTMSEIQSSAAAEACFIQAEITANSSMNTGGNLDLGLSLSGPELVLCPNKLSVKVNEIVQQLLSDRGSLPNHEIANESQLCLKPASPSSSPRLFAAAVADQSHSKLPACTHIITSFSEAWNETGTMIISGLWISKSTQLKYNRKLLLLEEHPKNPTASILVMMKSQVILL